MRIRFLLLFTFSFALTFFSSQIHAGGGRILMSYSSRGVAGGKEASIVAQVFLTAPLNADFSSNERVEFRIDNPRQGDKCNTRSERTNEQGIIGGFCTAELPGTISIYVYSLDKQDESSRHLLYFDPAPTPTPTPKQLPTPTKEPKPKATSTPSTLPIKKATSSAEKDVFTSTKPDSYRSDVSEISLPKSKAAINWRFWIFIPGMLILIAILSLIIVVIKKRTKKKILSENGSVVVDSTIYKDGAGKGIKDETIKNNSQPTDKEI